MSIETPLLSPPKKDGAQDIEEAQRLFMQSGLKQGELARRMEVSQSIISKGIRERPAVARRITAWLKPRLGLDEVNGLVVIVIASKHCINLASLRAQYGLAPGAFSRQDACLLNEDFESIYESMGIDFDQIDALVEAIKDA